MDAHRSPSSISDSKSAQNLFQWLFFNESSVPVKIFTQKMYLNSRATFLNIVIIVIDNCRHQSSCILNKQVWYRCEHILNTLVVFLCFAQYSVFPGTNCAAWKMFPIQLDFFFCTVRIPAGPAGLCRCQSLQEECLEEKGHRNVNNHFS